APSSAPISTAPGTWSAREARVKWERGRTISVSDASHHRIHARVPVHTEVSMDPAPPNARFVGTIPQHYDDGLGPVIFVPYADDIARRVRHSIHCGSPLEIACGTGLLTRRLLALPAEVRIVATDLNEAMLTFARLQIPS